MYDYMHDYNFVLKKCDSTINIYLKVKQIHSHHITQKIPLYVVASFNWFQ